MPYGLWLWFADLVKIIIIIELKVREQDLTPSPFSFAGCRAECSSDFIYILKWDALCCLGQKHNERCALASQYRHINHYDLNISHFSSCVPWLTTGGH